MPDQPPTDRPSLPLVLSSPRGRAKPPRHLADLDEAGRKALLEEMGLPGFRAKQLSTHYFGRLVDDPAEMTDLPAAQRGPRAPRPAPGPLSPLRPPPGARGPPPTTPRKALPRRPPP